MTLESQNAALTPNVKIQIFSAPNAQSKYLENWRTSRRTSYPILVQADPLIKRALDKYFKDHNQRGGGKWRMYHSDETRFYQTDDSKVTRRLLKEKSKLTFVDV